MSEKQQEMTTRQKEELQTQEGTREGIYFKPAVDIYETDEALTVVADLPGTGVEDIDIDLRDNQLTLTGIVNGDLDEQWEPLYAEYRSGHFMRQFQLGRQIDQSKISAHYDQGVLELKLPKAEDAVPRKIEVSTG